MSFNTDFLKRQADPNELSAIVQRQGTVLQQIGQSFVRVQRLDEIANEIGELAYRAVDADGKLRMIMSAIDLFEEFGVHAHFLGRDADGVPQVWLSADDGAIYGGGGDVFLNQYGLFFNNQEGLLGFQDAATGNYDNVGIAINGGDFLIIQNKVGDKGIIFLIDDAVHAVQQYNFEDGGMSIPAGGKYLVGSNALQAPNLLQAHALGATVPASTTHYICPPTTVLSTSQNNILVTLPGTLRNFYVRTGGAQPGTGSLVCTVFVNGVATALTFTIAASGGAGNYSNTTNTVAVNAGDRLNFQLVNNATGASATIGACVCEYDVDTK